MRLLTSYGRKFFVRAGAIAAAAILLIGGLMVELNKAHILFMNQQAFNVLFIAIVLPICVSILSVWFYDEVDRKTTRRVQSQCKG